MRILAIGGSLQKNSANHAVLRLAARHAGDAEFRYFDRLAEIPSFNADIDADEQPAVLALRNAVAAADAVLIATPEYAHSLPGVLKNALDWLVPSGELSQRIVGIIGVSSTPTGALRAIAALIQTLLAQSAYVTSVLPVAGIKPKIDAAGNVTHELTERLVAETVAALRDAVREQIRPMDKPSP